MVKHIVVATDGSDTAMRAVDMAIDLAVKYDVPLTVGHVLQFGRPADELARMADAEHIVEVIRQETEGDIEITPGVTGNPFSGGQAAGDMIRIVALIGEEIVRRAADRAKRAGVRSVATQTATGDTADAILDMADAAGADMIVLGHRGLGRVKTLILGSVAQKIVQQADCTVVSVR